jgi:hypothetical protein
MAFKSLAFSMFILCICIASEIPGYMRAEQPMQNKTWGEITSPRPIGLEDLGVSEDTQEVLNKYNLTAAPQDELSQGGETYRIKNTADMAYTILIKSTTGFYDFMIQLFHLNNSSIAKFLVLIAAAFVNLNHLIALGQLMGMDWGGKL